MTKKNKEARRVVIALTETSPLPDLWREALKLMDESSTELLALFVDDERWRRAASLPFTREISKTSGATADFTVQRAEQVHRETIAKVQKRIQELAAESDLEPRFQVTSETDQERIGELVGNERYTLVASSFIAKRPIYAHLSRLECRIVLIESAANTDR